VPRRNRSLGMVYNTLVELLIIGATCSVLSFLLGVVLKPYLRGYSAKKGENLATHEDIDKLVDQVSAVTQTAKEIESKISGELWNKQKHWEMKRDVIFEMSKKISGVDDALTSMYSTHMHYRTLAESGQVIDASMKAEALSKVTVNLGKSADAYDGALALMSIVCGLELHQALREFIIFTRQLVPQIQQNPPVYTQSAAEIAKRLFRIRGLLRKELGVDLA
jgi:hypothetical protein